MTPEEMNGLASIARKKVAMMSELKTFTKDKHNTSQNYGYASAELIFNTIRQLMTQHGLVLFMSAEEGDQKEFQSARGTRGLHTTVSYRMTWIDIDTGATFEDRWLSEGDDYQDKGYSKCATLALKYYLLSSFVVSSGDHADDSDSGIGSKEATPRRATTPKSRDKAQSGTTTSNGANTPWKQPDVSNQGLDLIPEDKATDHTTLKALTIVDKDGQKRLKFKSDDGRTVLAFTRQLFKERGWIDEAEWTGVGDYPINDGIPAGITFHRINEDGGYWEVSSVGEVTF